MVSVEPIITDTALPTKESGPKREKISDASAREPLPETGLKSAKGKSSDGKWKKSVMGDNKDAKKSARPDALKAPTAIKRANSAGKIDHTEPTPSLMPDTNEEYTSTFLESAYTSMATIIKGTTKALISPTGSTPFKNFGDQNCKNHSYG